MMSNIPKKTVKTFRNKYKLSEVDLKKIKKIISEMGYTLIEFDVYANDEDVETVIRNLGLSECVKFSNGFIYEDGNYRLIFVKEGLNSEEKKIVLSHEIGHIMLNHINHSAVIGRDVKEEYEANEFVHYLLKQSFFSKYKKLILTGVMLFTVLIILIATNLTRKEQSYYGEYYITPSGNKYHRRECVFVRDKKTAERLSVKEYEIGEYEACDMCLPDIISRK